MNDECESVTEAKGMSAKKKIDVLGAMAKYQLKKEEEKLKFSQALPAAVSQPTPSKAPTPMKNNKKPTTGETKVDMQKEVNIGITEYVDQREGFSAILKQRYSDFQVHEINMEGQVVVLTNQTMPEIPEEKVSVDEAQDCLTPEQWASVEDMMQSEEKKTVEIDVTDKSKEERNIIHKALRAKYTGQIASNSDPVNGRTIMKIFKHASDNKREERRWRGPPYLEFVLYKENLSTMEAISVISRKMGMRANMFQTAGTKDKRAVTCQLVTVKHCEPKRLLKSIASDRKILVGNFALRDQPLQLGQLKGNRFTIALRNVIGDEGHIKAKLESLKENGFVNYYGSQRFGTRHVPTHHIGKQLLLGNWREAIDLILEPPEHNGEFRHDYDLYLARVEWKATRNAFDAAAKLKRSVHTIEGQLLESLKKFGKDLVGALNTIPRNMRLTYIHAYQSFLWNTVVSKRLAKFGLQPIVGDLVYAPGQGDEGEVDVELDEQQEDNNKVEEAPAEASSSNQRAQRNQRKVIHLDESNIKNYTIHDVLLPLPGYDIVYPSNEVGKWFSELLAADGMAETSFKQSVKSYNLGGAYRLVMSKPLNVEWKFRRYDDPTLSLFPSDRDRLSNIVQLQQPVPAAAAEEGGAAAFLGLLLEFSLPPSSYATMALREITRMDMSAQFQTSLNEAGGTAKTTKVQQHRQHPHPRQEEEPECKRAKGST